MHATSASNEKEGKKEREKKTGWLIEGIET